jgi:uncharacterized sporulation protein YeaH/YhbH (DUF444 family)
MSTEPTTFAQAAFNEIETLQAVLANRAQEIEQLKEKINKWKELFDRVATTGYDDITYNWYKNLTNRK